MALKLKFKHGENTSSSEFHDLNKRSSKATKTKNDVIDNSNDDNDNLNTVIDVNFRDTSDKSTKKNVQPTNIKKTNRYFYKVSNHHELFKIGSSFYKDYLTGMKSFAITSTGYQTSQQNTILGLASFFDHKEDMKIAIISDNLYKGVFKDIISICSEYKKDFCDDDYEFDVHSFYGHFDFIDMKQITRFSEDDAGDYDELLDTIVDEYDVIFWDVPELHHIQKNSDVFFPVIMRYDSLAIIVAQSMSNSRDVEEIRLFFMGYGINLKGLIFDSKLKNKSIDKPSGLATDKQKKPWWRIF